MFDAEITAAATRLLDACKAAGVMVATAESCTGGLIAGADSLMCISTMMKLNMMNLVTNQLKNYLGSVLHVAMRQRLATEFVWTHLLGASIQRPFPFFISHTH